MGSAVYLWQVYLIALGLLQCSAILEGKPVMAVLVSHLPCHRLKCEQV